MGTTANRRKHGQQSCQRPASESFLQFDQLGFESRHYPDQTADRSLGDASAGTLKSGAPVF